MKPCNKVSEDARLECKEALANFKDQKTKRNELLQEIGMGPTSMHESALSKTIGTLGSGSGSGSGSWKQEERKEVCRKIGRFMYSKGLPFNTVNDPYWFPIIDAVANFGPGFKPSSMHELRTWILKEEVNDLSIIMEDHKKAWKQYGCSIMSDGWTDGKSRCLINFLVNSPVGTWFMKSIDASDTIKNGELMFKYLDEVVEEIGEENVVQKKWCSSTWAKKVEGVKTRSTVLFDPNFWPHVAFCIKTTVPLVSVLREVDSEERPAMGYIYELMDSAKEKIAFNCRGMERKYGPIWRKIDARWTSQLHRPLHAAGYYLNPQLRYGDKFSNVDEVRKGLFECMDRMLDYQERLKADIQLDSYDQAMGEFGSRIAIDSRTLRSPTSWWMRFGGSTPELQKFAIRVLSLTCSASGCERNWSTFESRSLQRKQNVDPILVEEIDSNDEWIAEKEDPLLPLDLCWLQDNELFNVDAIRVVSSNSQETQASSNHMVSSHSYKGNIMKYQDLDLSTYIGQIASLKEEFSTLSSLPCESCQLGKYTRVSFPKRLNNRAKSPFELVHTDVWGPSPFTSFMSHHGILHQSSCAHTPQQNGVAERKNRHLVETARTILLHSNVPFRFWGDAVLTACYLINRMPSSVLHDQIPHSLLFPNQPLYFLPPRVFGCTCFVHILTPRQDKLSAKAMKCLFLGYSRLQKGYRCYSLETHRYFISVDVTFFEDSPFFSTTSESLPVSEVLPLPIVSPTDVVPPRLLQVYHRRPRVAAPLPFAEAPADSLPTPSASPVPALPSPDDLPIAIRKGWRQTMVDEMAALHSNGTWDLVVLPSVAKGYTQIYGLDYGDTFSPVAKIAYVRMLLSMAAMCSWPLYQLDIKNVFLHGDLVEEVYMEQPPGFIAQGESGLVCKLRRSLYGLKQSPRAWFGRFSSVVQEFGMLHSTADHSVFYHHNPWGSVFILLFMWTTSSLQLNPVPVWSFPKGRERLGDPGRYRRLVGKLNYLTITCPDISFPVSVVSQFLQSPCDSHWDAMQIGLAHPQIDVPLQGTVFLYGGNIISWKSKKQDVVAKSSAEAEYRAMALATCELIWLRHLLQELRFGKDEQMKLICDNQAALHIASNPVFHERTKHIEVDCHFH
ncbi:Retrovirus-related Pol polyprotein from transposon TNT 1-94 [Vitis vinifera]|uniref:Retrovirus-related Pol polyprotein from transposon TNT 1-94 n=1 Tax=Vitis vinifera TaxID=29760 RepID=A0A438D9K9_VITVI|nr:Retrovirus-related Pol polyprotein from transposon TNT 1-94 [Vitis vinifera]